MPRRRSSSSGMGSRSPRAAPSRSLAPRQTAPPAAPQNQAQLTQPRQPGLFGQMASTAAGVAVGSTIGHTLGAGITGMFSGGNSGGNDQQQPVQQQGYDQLPSTTNYYGNSSQNYESKPCEGDMKAFMDCMRFSDNNVNTCESYLSMLKACQAAQSQQSW
eukprot:TRINITY_DN19910_c0_g1_i1.p1 TRINITY_DN19910_c0_g1~~TRINITY_DN19910_c0_g1_i1.p1  ORF type:complete len:160 (-),score=25.45 TRINITY_DN19910_c0_g1_i1:130-609(-)